MDPNAALIETRALVARILADDTYRMPERAIRLAELVGALDEWLTSGGFLPQAWTKPEGN